jgi:phosphoglucomutase
LEYHECFDLWRTDPFFDEETHRELAALTDPAEIRDRFCCDLEFGTAGLRGVMAAGTNRMNRYTVRRATQALAEYLIASEGDAIYRRGVVIAHDSRLHSEEFARETALTLCANNIPAYCFDTLMPTPVLSFSVRHLGCLAGVMITASHNPKEYNGYKAFDRDGCQLLPKQADAVLAKMRLIPMTSVTLLDRREALSRGLLREVPLDTLDAFLEAATAQSHALDASAKSALHVVYSPLNGAGNVPVRRILERQGYDHVTVVPEQEKPDGLFPTVPVPNPQNASALSLAIRLAGTLDADLVLATDPDCDRLAIAVLHDGLYQIISGNQLGALLVCYLLTRRGDRLTPASTLVKSVVTGELGASVARANGMQVVEVLPGFKYIGDQIRRCETDPTREFVMGYEESCGYLIGTHARDKDAVGASLLVCEMAAFYKMHGKTLVDVLSDLHEQYGCCMSQLDSFSADSPDWKEKTNAVMALLRTRRVSPTADAVTVLDYSTGVAGLPKTDMLKLTFADGSWMAIRPSGTEPKIKIYYWVGQADRPTSEALIAAHRKTVLDFFAHQDGFVRE